MILPGGAKVRDAWPLRPGKYLKLVATWEGIWKLYYRIAIKDKLIIYPSILADFRLFSEKEAGKVFDFNGTFLVA